MENNYYTPKIEEFYEGFLYESPSNLGNTDKDIYHVEAKLFVSDEWETVEYSRQQWLGYSGEDYLPTLIENKMIRVKHLDQSDIEGLSFNLDVALASETISVFKKEIMFRGEKNYVNLYFNRISNWVLICVGEYMVTEWYDDGKIRWDIIPGNTVFAGIIKNKSALKAVMEMIEVIE